MISPDLLRKRTLLPIDPSRKAGQQPTVSQMRGVVSLGFDADGKRIRPKVSGKTKTEVKDKLKELHSAPGGSAGGIAGKVTCYAIVDALSSRAEPAGVLRRIEHEGGQRDEAFGYDLAWRHTFLVYSAERGNLDNRIHEIGEDEADRIQARIRQSSTAEQR